MKLSEQVREAVNSSGMSRYAICKAIGLDQAVMSRFMAGECGLALPTLDRLCELLGLELKAAKKRRGAK